MLKRDSSDDIHSVVMAVCTIYHRFILTQFASCTWQYLLAIRAIRHSWAHTCRLCHIQDGRGTITKATGLSNGKSLVQRSQQYSTGQFSVTHGIAKVKIYCKPRNRLNLLMFLQGYSDMCYPTVHHCFQTVPEMMIGQHECVILCKSDNV